MKKYFQKILRLIILAQVIIIAIPQEFNVNAASSNETQIRNKFVENLNSYYGNPGNWSYDIDNDHSFYTLGPSATSHTTECVGWVAWAFKWLISFDGKASSITTGSQYVTGGLVDPHGPTYINNTKFFEGPYEIKSSGNSIDESCGILPGDIVICAQGTENGHVGIYIGNNQVMHFIGHITITNGTHYTGNRYFTAFAHWKGLDDISFSNVEGGTEITGGYIPGDTIDYVDLDNLDFNLNGNPQEMQYNGKKQLFSWDFSKISQFLDYIIGIIISGIKAAFVGWANIVEAFINGILKSVL